MAWNVTYIDEDHTEGVPAVASGSSGPDLANDKPLVGSDGKLVGAVSDIPAGFVVDELASDDPRDMSEAYGDGCIIEKTDASWTKDGAIWSDGDGTISQTKPGSTGGDTIVRVGVAINSTEFRVDIEAYERGA